MAPVRQPFVKIGWSSTPWRRLKRLEETGYASGLELLRVFPATEVLCGFVLGEYLLHIALEPWRILVPSAVGLGGVEWFHLRGPVFTFLNYADTWVVREMENLYTYIAAYQTGTITEDG